MFVISFAVFLLGPEVINLRSRDVKFKDIAYTNLYTYKFYNRLPYIVFEFLSNEAIKIFAAITL